MSRARRSTPADPARVSVWATAQSTQRVQRAGRYVPGHVAHPARMYPAIAAHAIAAYTQPGDLVLDPMCGIGTTLVEAMHLGRDAFGVEYEPRWAELSDANIAHTLRLGVSGSGAVIRGDSTHLGRLLPRALHGHVALVLTSPPYGPAVHGKITAGPRGVVKTEHVYGADRGNLAYQSTDQLIGGFTRILEGCRQVLRPGGLIAVTARPFRRDGILIDLPSAVIGAGLDAQLTPVAVMPASLAALRGGQFVARPSFFQLGNIRKARTAGLPMHLIAHEDLVLLRSPRTTGEAA